MRHLVAETRVDVANLVAPLFVREGIDEPQPIVSMPGVVQHTRDSLRAEVTELADLGIGAVILFGVPSTKDSIGSKAFDPEGIVQLCLADLAEKVGDRVVLMADLCVDEYTDHGHCGVLDDEGRVDNDATLDRYTAMGVAQAEAGAHLVGTSGMMDGQVGAVRAALDRSAVADVGILAYSAKYASGFYGPFREAVDSSLRGDRKTYQQDPARSVTEALAETALDVSEGADIVMVKPALPYLDILRAVADASPVPVAAYQVSGEFAMVEAAAANGWLDRDRVMIETLTAIRRAGASMILTYWAVEAAAILR